MSTSAFSVEAGESVEREEESLATGKESTMFKTCSRLA